MAYKPTPYSRARAVSKDMLRGYSDIEVSLEFENPSDPDGDLSVHIFCLFYKIMPAEPDVGAMREYIDDWFYANWDGSPVPEPVWVEIDKIHARNDDRSPVCRLMDDWHERNLERALEGEL